jgi:hypothetical protein
MLDPGKQREKIMAECERRGIVVEQKGQAFVLRGPGVDLKCADLAILDERDLQPYQPNTRGRT